VPLLVEHNRSQSVTLARHYFIIIALTHIPESIYLWYVLLYVVLLQLSCGYNVWYF